MYCVLSQANALSDMIDCSRGWPALYLQRLVRGNERAKRLENFCEQRHGSQQSRVVAQLRGPNLNFSPRRPGMFLNVRLNRGEDYISALHHPATNHDEFRIIGMYQAHGIGCPDRNAPVSNGSRNRVSIGSLLKEFLETDIRIF